LPEGPGYDRYYKLNMGCWRSQDTTVILYLTGGATGNVERT
jgi:hypothetical protein